MGFKERLKDKRLEAGLTQAELAKKASVTTRTIQNYEMGVRKPTYEMLIAIADYFDVSLDYLVGRSDNPERR